MALSPSLLLLSMVGVPDAPERVSDTQGTYQYESVSDTSKAVSRIKIDVHGKELVYPATITPLEACPKARAGCFHSTRMSFCAPSKYEISAGKWDCGGEDLRFTLKGTERLRLLGHEVDTFVIQGRGVEYFFSATHGIVMFRFVDQPVAEVYWSVGAHGYASEP